MHASLMFLAMAAVPPATAAPAADAPKTAEDKPVCRTERATGSRVFKKVCMSADQRRKQIEDDRAKLGMRRNTQVPDAFKHPGE